MGQVPSGKVGLELEGVTVLAMAAHDDRSETDSSVVCLVAVVAFDALAPTRAIDAARIQVDAVVEFEVGRFLYNHTGSWPWTFDCSAGIGPASNL